MAYRDVEKGRAYQRRWYHAYKKKRAETRRRNQLRIREWFEQLRSRLRCVRCPENHPACLSFHHRPGTKKSFEISMAVARGFSIELISLEMAKCDVLCVNCHLLVHAEQASTKAKRRFPRRQRGKSPYAL